MWLENGKCSRSQRRVKADHENFVIAPGGHVFQRDGENELDEIDAGSQCVSVPCVNCDKWVGVLFSNDIEHGGDETPYIPSEAHWRKLNRID